jgi:hypothetical protein
MQATVFEPTFIVDISKTIKEKMDSIRAFSSQFYNPQSDEPETFISKPEFLEFLEARTKFYGFQIGVKNGEPFYSDEKIDIDLKKYIKEIDKIDWR